MFHFRGCVKESIFLSTESTHSKGKQKISVKGFLLLMESENLVLEGFINWNGVYIV